MRSIKQLLDSVTSLDMDRIADDTLEGTKDEIADFNIDQLRHGISQSGEHFKPYQNEEYAEMKNRLNPLPGFGNPDYILTGDFSSRVEAKVTKEGFQLTSTDSKLEKLIERDPEDPPVGLAPETHDKALREVVRPYFESEITEATGLKFN